MQGEIIANRILQDGQIRADEIIEEAKQKAQKINSEAEEYALSKKEETQNIINEKAMQIQERYVVLSRIEGNKIILNKKQELLSNLKQKTLEALLKQDKAILLSFIEKLLKENASKGETLKINTGNISVKDVEALKIVKDKNLKVTNNKNSEEIGLILSSENMDKNLTFAELINDAYLQCQGEIGKILFGE